MKEPSTQDRRRLKRRSISYYMLVIEADTQKMIGHLVDITPKGLMLDTQYPIPLGKEYRLRIETTPDVADKGFIEFKARSVWRTPDPVEAYLNDVGFEITDIRPHDAEIIQHIVDRYGKHDPMTF
jgi:hypothetical protein